MSSANDDALFQRAWMLQNSGHLDDAILIYRQILEKGESAHAWIGLGQCFLALKNHDNALNAFRRSAMLMPESGAIRHLIAMLEKGPTPDRAPDDYVTWVFDGHADNFDSHLAALNYRGPEMIASLAAIAWKDGPKRKILDLGCGTGLNALFFRDYANRLDGVDLAQRMLQAASKRGYTYLYKSEAHRFLENTPIFYDAILSTDVFIYIGRLENIFLLSHKALTKSGEIFCTIELAEQSDEPVQLMQTGRFRQTHKYVVDCAEAAGFKVVDWIEDALRIENGIPELGRAYHMIKS